MVWVTNKGASTLKDRHLGVDYEFRPGVPVEVPESTARHIFGYGDDKKEPYLVRLGWLRLGVTREDGFKRLSEFVFSNNPPTMNHSVPSVVGSVAPLPLPRRGRGAKGRLPAA